MEIEHTKILALDIGDKRIGCAVTDAYHLTIRPEKTILRKGLQKDLEQLIETIKTLEIKTIVVGMPYQQDNKIALQGQKISAFIDQLKKKLRKNQELESIRFVFWDEHLTSWEAEKRLQKRGRFDFQKKGEIDAMAACIILEDYLASYKISML